MGIAVAQKSDIRLPDGRVLCCLELGHRGGSPVFAFHGTPGSSRQFGIHANTVEGAGVWMIALDRPGFGGSTFHKHATLLDWPRDVAAVMQALGITQCSVLGVSGGGPYALACARALWPEVRHAMVVSSVRPLADAEAVKGMLPINQVLVALSRVSMALPVVKLGELVARLWPQRALRAFYPSSADSQVMAQPDIGQMLLEDLSTQSRTAARATAHDFRLLIGDWGFQLADISTSVSIWHGTEDRNVPAHHATFLASQLARATLHEVEGAGHLLVHTELPNILRSMPA